MMLKKLVTFSCLSLMLVLVNTSMADVDVPGLLGWWPLNEGSGDTVVDLTGSGNDGTIENEDSGGLGNDDSVWYNDPNRGMVLSFNGDDDNGAFVSFSEELPAMSLINDFTWMFWAKQLDDGSGEGDIIFGNRFGGPANEQWMKFTPTKIECVNVGHVGTLDYEDVPENVWVHMCLVKDGPNLTHYRNGEALGTSALTAAIDELPMNLAGGDKGERWSGWLSDVYLYTKALTQEEILLHMDGFQPELASIPSPGNEESDVLRDISLTWIPGISAVKHNVYLGTIFEDVNTADIDSPLLVGSSLDVNRIEIATLEFDQTYFWRVDEIKADSEIAIGKVWSFTVEPHGLKITGIAATASSSETGKGPENTVDESGLDVQDGHSSLSQDMWLSEKNPAEPLWIQYDFDQLYKLDLMSVWNCNFEAEIYLGMGLKDVTIETTQDGQVWTVFGDYEFAQAPGEMGYQANTTIDFGGILAQGVRLTVNSAWGTTGVYGLSEVRFLYIPTWPREPQPELDAVGVDTDLTLSWRSGRDADTHTIHWGPNEQDVLDGTASVETVYENALDISGLDMKTSYYWRVEEVNTNEAMSTWSSPVWNFQTKEQLVIDDFETYSEDEGSQVWWSWLDGYENDNNGSEIDHEYTVVHQGYQSMAFYYGNNKNKDSEIIYEFESQDWTRSGAQLLVLYFYGSEDNDEGDLYLKINNQQVDYNGNASDLTRTSWNLWTIDLTSLDFDLTNVTSLAIGIPYSGDGVLYIDDIGLYQTVPTIADQWVEGEKADKVVEPMRKSSYLAGGWGNQYIAAYGSNGEPPEGDEGVASFSLNLDAGTYRILGRTYSYSGDSFWVRLQGATTDIENYWEDSDGESTEWIQWGLDGTAAWTIVPVQSMDNDDQQVLFTIPEDGQYTLEIACRQQYACLDAFMITADLED